MLATGMLSRLRSLTSQFVVVGGIIMLAVMLLAGYLISTIVSRDAVRSTAASSALFMQAIAGEHLAVFSASTSLPAETIQELDEVFGSASFRGRFPYLEIWSPDGSILYSNSPELIGQSFQPPAGLRRALQGEVAAEYTDLAAREHTIRGFQSQFLEIYSPLRRADGEIVAVAEIHESAEPLRRQLTYLQRITWGTVIASTLLIAGSLFGVVRRGSSIIARQELALRRRIEEAEHVSEQNRALRDRVRRASVRAAELNEQFLKRLGADLHDGPTQLLTFAILQAGHLRGTAPAGSREGFDTLLATLSDTARDLRAIARGLLLPEAQDQTLESLLITAIQAHETRTDTKVTTEFRTLDVPTSLVVAACSYRFVQEGLNNAYRHSGGSGQIVRAAIDFDLLEIAVFNDVVKDTAPEIAREQGLGLLGLRSRVESLGGTFVFERTAVNTVALRMRLNLSDEILQQSSD
jgi:signal transduction histidine kinase